MKYIQSFYQYPVTFSSIEKTIPGRNDDGELRNLIEVTDDECEKLQNAEPLFRALVNEKKYRVLNKMPESYKPPATLVNEAREEAERMAKENAELKARLGMGNNTDTPEGDTETAEEQEAEKTAKNKGGK